MKTEDKIEIPVLDDPRSKGEDRYSYFTRDIIVSPRENRRLLKAADKEHPETIWKFVMSNMRFVRFIVTKKFGPVVTDDMMSDGTLGFYCAVSKYKKGYSYGSFMSYAGFLINKFVREEMLFRRSQLEPLQKKKGEPEVTPMDSVVGEDGMKLTEIVSDPLTYSPADEMFIYDDEDFYRHVKDFMMRGKYASKHRYYLEALMDTGSLGAAAKQVGRSRQMIAVMIDRLLVEIRHRLYKEPVMAGELRRLMGKKMDERMKRADIFFNSVTRKSKISGQRLRARLAKKNKVPAEMMKVGESKLL